MKIGIIIQARMLSTRLPGKVLKKINNNKVVLEMISKRLEHVENKTDIIFATSKNKADDKIEEFCRKKKYAFFRGDEKNVLKRYYEAAKSFNLDVVVRCNADCPLIDSKIVNKVILEFLNSDADYVSNILKPSFPVGMHTEVFSFKSLKKAFKEASDEEELEHVTPYFYRNPEKFKLKNVKHSEDLSHHRWTLDYKEDLNLISKIYFELKNKDIFSMEEILEVFEKQPTLFDINSHYKKDGTV
tara:strand:+ start:636 stop:1364 length:729 start_codon:yes stop_codon:yes gene_type:complete